jgi:hypothetical protein
MGFFWSIAIAFFFLFSWLYFGVMHNAHPRLTDEIAKAAKATAESARARFRTTSEMLGNTPLGHMKHLYEYNDLLVAHLQKMQRYAHVALDLTLIAGLTILAVAIVVMQGVRDINVLSAISVLFLLVGTISHLSHMMRLVHVYLQYDARFIENKTMHNVGPKRVALMFVSLVLLAMYFVFAAETTVQESHLLAQKLAFTFMAFCIWYFADICFELPCCYWNQAHTRPGYDAINHVERFWTHLRYKNAITATTIVVGVLVMSVLRANVVLAAANHGNYRTQIQQTAASGIETAKMYKELSIWNCWFNMEPSS